jgi:Putative F0F1-ATPase subunit Ca2+/Mg2+ transporter
VPGPSKDDRPPMVVAIEWTTQITSIAVEMAAPAWLGHWADQRWGTEPWLVSVGACLGFSMAMVHLLALTKTKNGPRRNGSGRSGS